NPDARSASAHALDCQRRVLSPLSQSRNTNKRGSRSLRTYDFLRHDRSLHALSRMQRSAPNHTQAGRLRSTRCRTPHVALLQSLSCLRDLQTDLLARLALREIDTTGRSTCDASPISDRAATKAPFAS